MHVPYEQINIYPSKSHTDNAATFIHSCLGEMVKFTFVWVPAVVDQITMMMTSYPNPPQSLHAAAPCHSHQISPHVERTNINKYRARVEDEILDPSYISRKKKVHDCYFLLGINYQAIPIPIHAAPYMSNARRAHYPHGTV
jgi:hypothetical protein